MMERGVENEVSLDVSFTYFAVPVCWNYLACFMLNEMEEAGAVAKTASAITELPDVRLRHGRCHLRLEIWESRRRES